jgi:hypothetical protein
MPAEIRRIAGIRMLRTEVVLIPAYLLIRAVLAAKHRRNARTLRSLHG